jgi:chorismate synthase
MSDHFGKNLTITSYGESHGPGIGVVISGLPANIPISAEEIQAELHRRRPGQSKLSTPRKEQDNCQIQSGTYQGKTTGTALALFVANEDARSKSYADFQDLYRPSHADFTYEAKYGFRDWRGGGRASARETIARVAAGAIAQKALRLAYNIDIVSWVQQIHELILENDYGSWTRQEVEASPVRCPEPSLSQKMADLISQTQKEGDSLGGVVACRLRRVPAGLGEPIFDKLEADLAKAMLSIPAAKGFEIGSGFGGVTLKGSQHNDPFTAKEQSTFAGEAPISTTSNRSGGIQGGISNGEDILFRVAFKPTATIFHDQETVDRRGRPATLKAKGRHDPCVLPRAVPIVDNMAALVILDHILRHEAYHRFQPNISSQRGESLADTPWP